MSSVNKAILIGHLGKDPESKTTSNGSTVTNFSIATSEKWTGKDGQKNEKTNWHRIVAWGRLAEITRDYLHKGSQVYIEGKIETRDYDDKQGVKRYITEIIASSMTMLGGKPDGNGSDQPKPQARGPRDEVHGDAWEPINQETPPPILDDDVPF